ncbi:MAG: MBL fold metallo-hydrolase [Candidatus Stygibacter frigidus]|nr:MBL fold metallo-hydrolase [Candidatus Stygibacter frigidus]
MIIIKWFGHSFWKITTDKISIVIDPFTDIGYNMDIDVSADVLLSSHDHFDHNNIDLIKGNPLILKEAGKFEHGNSKFELIQVWHDKKNGKQRGKNLLMKFTVGGKTFLHCGDLGHMPSPEIIGTLKNIDVLLLPVGGIFTIDAQEAIELVKIIKPKIIFPMHYDTPALNFDLAPVDDFLKYYDNILRFNKAEIELIDDYFCSNQFTIMVLNYE